jgi:hypothetical protein
MFFLAMASHPMTETGHNRRGFASQQPVTAAFSGGAVKKGNTLQAMAALCG